MSRWRREGDQCIPGLQCSGNRQGRLSSSKTFDVSLERYPDGSYRPSRWAIKPWYTEQFRIALSSFMVFVPTIQLDCPSMEVAAPGVAAPVAVGGSSSPASLWKRASMASRHAVSVAYLHYLTMCTACSFTTVEVKGETPCALHTLHFRALA